MASFYKLWRRWQTRDYPEHMLTKAEAIECVRLYAESNGRRFLEPSDICIERRLTNREDRTAGFRHVFVIALGTSRPVPYVEVDAVSGKVLAWRSLSR
jgi:hypothetical protein